MTSRGGGPAVQAIRAWPPREKQRRSRDETIAVCVLALYLDPANNKVAPQ